MILKILRKKEGLTIVEVLVSVVLLSIVSVYGLAFFAATWRLNVESRDYAYIMKKLENYVEAGKGYFQATGGTIANRTVTIPNETLRTGDVVAYTYQETAAGGYVNVLATASWPLRVEVKSRKKLGIRTHFAPVWPR